MNEAVIVLGKRLILDELFDLMLYRRLRAHSSGDLTRMFDKLIPVGEGHASWAAISPCRSQNASIHVHSRAFSVIISRKRITYSQREMNPFMPRNLLKYAMSPGI